MKKCPVCVGEVTYKKFCSTTCQMISQRAKRKEKFLEGGYVGQHLKFPTGYWTRDVLIELYGYKCNQCELDKWQDKAIVLEVNHKDGIASNNHPNNLEFLCPNCHSQTSTFRNKNRNRSTRTYRRKPD